MIRHSLFCITLLALLSGSSCVRVERLNGQELMSHALYPCAVVVRESVIYERDGDLVCDIPRQVRYIAYTTETNIERITVAFLPTGTVLDVKHVYAQYSPGGKPLGEILIVRTALSPTGDPLFLEEEFIILGYMVDQMDLTHPPKGAGSLPGG